MSSSVNKIFLVGNLGVDPEIRTMGSGGEFARLSVATSDTWKDRETGERRENTEWHRVVIWDEHLTDVCKRFLKKGSKVYIEGRIRTRKWQDQNGQDRYTTEIHGDELQMLDSRGGNMNDNMPSTSGSSNYASSNQAPSSAQQVPDNFDDDIPF